MTGPQRLLIVLLLLVLPVAGAQAEEKKPPPPEPLDAATREFHQQHLRLDVTPDIRKGTIEGRLELRFESLVDEMRMLRLHSKDTKIESVQDASGKALAYRHRAGILEIDLPGPLSSGAVGTVKIRYKSTPKRGLYFHAPSEAHPTRPLFMYSQGQGTDNRRWIPCYDEPDDRCSWQISVNTEDPLVSVSNGAKIATIKDKDGPKRTDVWSFDGRAPTYLISLIVAPLETIQEKWRDVLLEYSAVPGHTEALKTSLAETANMMEFFSNYLEAPYPWPRYAQTYVWDFIYGGMENVTATTLNMRALHTKEARPNYMSEGLVAHELAHMWFGDLLTCRTWEHIWLNEGFATYFTDLFFEDRYGTDTFLLRRRRQNRGYMRGTPNASGLKLEKSPRGDIPLELFGGKQYSRGAAILHNLRKHLGDELFRDSIRAYVKAHADCPVTSEDLRTVVEEVAGEDLQWFWNQWVYGLGYPKFDVRYDDRNKQLVVRQTQKPGGGQGVFRMRVPIRWGTGTVQELWIYRDRHVFPMEKGGKFLRFGVGGDLLMNVKQHQSATAWADALADDPDPTGRLDAAEALEEFGPVAVPALAKALQEDTCWAVREACAGILQRLQGTGSKEALLAAVNDTDSRVRVKVMEALGATNRRVAGEAVVRAAREDPHPYVRSAAARSAGRLKVKGGRALLASLLEVDSHGDVVRAGALEGLRHLGDRSAVELALPFLDYRWGKGANHRMRKQALDCVTALKPDDRGVHEALVALLDDPYHSMRSWAATACGKYGVKRAIPALERLRKGDWNGGVKGAARKALERLRKKKNVKKPA